MNLDFFLKNLNSGESMDIGELHDKEIF